MQKNLVIVESPAKAKTIEKFLGSDFKVMSSYGHIRDLKKKNFGVDLETFDPQYEIPADKKHVVSELRAQAKKVEAVWLASDEDREGEAISWHLAEVLGLDPKETRRIVFHEITKPAILAAIENPRHIDLNLVDAQQARRVLDRLVGFKLSPVLWRKVRPSLSAGRVQSVAVRLIVEREREINAFRAEDCFRVTALFEVPSAKGPAQLKAELNRRFPTQEAAEAFLQSCKGADFTIEQIATRPAKRTPAPPFTTSTLQQEAARKLGFSVAMTMRVAQGLYESGLITYMRTDSMNLSDLCLNSCAQVIEQLIGKEYHQQRAYHTRAKGAQEAHEAIRPTDMSRQKISGTAQEQRLYELIWKRTLACQMADAKLEKTTVGISVTGREEMFQALGEVIRFDGFLKYTAKAWAMRITTLRLRRAGLLRNARRRTAEAFDRTGSATLYATTASLHGSITRTQARGIGHRPSVNLRSYDFDHSATRVRKEGGSRGYAPSVLATYTRRRASSHADAD